MLEGVLGRFCGRFWLDQGAGLTSIPGMGMSILQVSFLIDNRLLFVSVNTVNVGIKGHRVMRPQYNCGCNNPDGGGEWE